MMSLTNFSRERAISLATLFAVVLGVSLICAAKQSEARQEKAEAWSSADVLRPEDLLAQLNRKEAKLPTIIYVGFRTLFEGGHVPGAKFYGTASTEKGLADLQAAVAGLPRATDLVIYCGCCPLEKCPNIRPAYKALHEMGFAHLRVLALPTSFAADWVEKGYPIEKGL